MNKYLKLLFYTLLNAFLFNFHWLLQGFQKREQEILEVRVNTGLKTFVIEIGQEHTAFMQIFFLIP